METTSNLLVLKYSSKQVTHKTNTGEHAIDHTNIAEHGRQAAQFLESNTNSRLVVVTSAARKLLGHGAWSEVADSWGAHFDSGYSTHLVSDGDIATTGLRHVFESVRAGQVAIVNGDDSVVGTRHHNNDYVAADIAKLAVAGRFQVELGIFTNAAGLCTDVTDDETVIRVVHNIGKVRNLASDSEDNGTTGGMSTKLSAAEEALAHGVSRIWIADGRAEDALLRARAGIIGTAFVQTAVGTEVAL